MKRVAMSVVTAFVFFLAMAYAQTSSQTPDSSSSSQGTTQSSPSMSGSQGSQDTSSGTMGQSSSSGEMKGEKGEKGMKGEKTLKGCIESENGSYMLQERSGKEVALTGADVSAHSGHEVKVHGTWESGASASSSMGSESGSMGTSAKAGKTFNVTSMDMVSETCKMGKKSSKSSMGSSSGNTTQPPQK